MEAAEVHAVVTAYGVVLSEPAALRMVRDIRSLPFEKKVIKAALRIALQVTYDPRIRNPLEVAYVSLADFQELSDKEIKAIQAWNRTIRRITTAPSDVDVAEVAKALAADGEIVLAIQDRVSKESRSLQDELQVADA